MFPMSFIFVCVKLACVLLYNVIELQCMRPVLCSSDNHSELD